MGARSTGSHPTTTKADGHLLEYFRQNFDVGGGANSGPTIVPSGLTATGGVINDYSADGYIWRAHTFTASGAFNVTDLGDGGPALVPAPPVPKFCLKYSKRCPSAFVVVG